MHPAARTLQIIFLVFGFGFIGLSLLAATTDEETIYVTQVEWTCYPDPSLPGKASCATDGGLPVDSSPLQWTLIGLAFVVASASIAAGGYAQARTVAIVPPRPLAQPAYGPTGPPPGYPAPSSQSGYAGQSG